MRTPFVKFIREYFLRQFGFKHVANKAFADVLASAKHYTLPLELRGDRQSHKGPSAPSERAILFLSMLGVPLDNSKGGGATAAPEGGGGGGDGAGGGGGGLEKAAKALGAFAGAASPNKKRASGVAGVAGSLKRVSTSSKAEKVSMVAASRWNDAKVNFLMWFTYAVVMNDDGSKLTRQACNGM